MTWCDGLGCGSQFSLLTFVFGDARKDENMLGLGSIRAVTFIGIGEMRLNMTQTPKWDRRSNDRMDSQPASSQKYNSMQPVSAKIGKKWVLYLMSAISRCQNCLSIWPLLNSPALRPILDVSTDLSAIFTIFHEPDSYVVYLLAPPWTRTPFITSRAPFQYKDRLYMYGIHTISFYHGHSYTGKIASIYCESPQVTRRYLLPIRLLPDT